MVQRLNVVGIAGWAGGEPEIELLEENRRQAAFSIAVDIGYKDNDGQWRDRTGWVRVVTFRDKLIKKLETCNGGLKGRFVMVGQGSLRARDKGAGIEYMAEIEADKITLFNHGGEEVEKFLEARAWRWERKSLDPFRGRRARQSWVFGNGRRRHGGLRTGNIERGVVAPEGPLRGPGDGGNPHVAPRQGGGRAARPGQDPGA